MNERAKPFANLAEPQSFAPKPPRERAAAEAAVAQISEKHNFPSREAPKAQRTPRRKPRIHRTGRNQQITMKATAETIDKFYKLAEEKKVVLGECLRLAVEALEREAGRGSAAA